MPILDWLNKDRAVRTAQRGPYRLLEQVPELGYGDADAENMLIQGGNLEALKALIPLYAGKVLSVFILIRRTTPGRLLNITMRFWSIASGCRWCPHLELLRELLTEDGSIWEEKVIMQVGLTRVER